jgi:isochorismate hydrolase
MLETEIKNLSAQIEKLNSNFEALFNKANSEPVKEEPKTEKVETTTAQDIKDLCLIKARSNKDNKAKIKSILKDKGASVVDDLKETDYEEVKKLIGAL